MCAIEAGKRGRSVCVIEHAEKIGKKILISGGGRCNFTNLTAGPHAFISENEHFAKSALSRYTQEDFIALVKKHGIEFYEKTLGQLFCKGSAREIVGMLEEECKSVGVKIFCNCSVQRVERVEGGGEFVVTTNRGMFSAQSLVVATGGISIPKMGATGFGYELAEQFGLGVTERRAGLVPFIGDGEFLKEYADLSGIAMEAVVTCGGVSFRENVLIKHGGLSGPAILQISSYWKPGQAIYLNLLPDLEIGALIAERKLENDRIEVKTLLAEHLPKRFVERVFEKLLVNKPLKQLNTRDIKTISEFFHSWHLIPASTEGTRSAEVTVGGVDTDELSSKTFESKKVPGLYFIGEVIDVTGWLGGYNFQWAWSSGFCCGQFC